MSGKHLYFWINEAGCLTINMIITQLRKHGLYYLSNQSNYRKIVIFDSDLIISLFVLKLNLIKFLIKYRASYDSSTANLYTIYTCHHTICKDCKNNISQNL